MQMNGSFNANQFEPNQGMSGHPPCQKAPFTITDTAIVENKAKDGGMFVVHLTSPMGTQVHRYNIWNKEPKAVEIAHGQLSALCRATGRYQIDWGNEGAALKGGQGLMDIGYQKGEEPTAEKPNGGYTELKKVYDMAGNEPGKSGQQAQPQAQAQPQQNAPMVSQGNGAWGQTAPNPNPSQQAPQGQGTGQAWQPGGAGNAAAPPWGNRQ
jgi:hypothetical protein